MQSRFVLTRRGLIQQGASMSGALALKPALVFGAAPAIVTSENSRPAMPYGVQAGDVLGDRAVIWSRVDRPARMMVEISTTESFTRSWKITGPAALEDTDFTAKLDIVGLPLGQRVFYRVAFQDLGDLVTLSEPVVGSFTTPPAGKGTSALFGRVIWLVKVGASTRNGAASRSMRRCVRPSQIFFSIPAIRSMLMGLCSPEVTLPDGSVWKNLTTEAKMKPAETLAEFRGNHAYNLLDDNVRRFNAEVASYIQWDDHEVTNNWYRNVSLESQRPQI